MKAIAVSMRADVNGSYLETRDSLDQEWLHFFSRCNLLPVLIPNNVDIAKGIFQNYNIDGLLLTGGNDVGGSNETDISRDKCEEMLINFAMDKKLPTLGICRGMQFIGKYFGADLTNCHGHVNKTFPIIHKKKCRQYPELSQISSANAYHNYQLINLPDELLPLCYSECGVLKAVEHKNKPILGIMWHPERERPFRSEELELFRHFFKGF
jgi:putative glutamine amidotransferase